MLKHIIKELSIHVPFTFFGAVTGIVIMILIHKMPTTLAYTIDPLRSMQNVPYLTKIK